jgi:predicted deacylase
VHVAIDGDTGDGAHPSMIVLTGEQPGPTVAILGGVHGDEIEGVLAARRIIEALRGDGALRGGEVRVAAPAHPAAWAAGTRVSPVDGGNLARVFPGSAEGGPTERVAAHLTQNVLAGADLLVDLHSAGRTFDMPLLVGYHSGDETLSPRSAAAGDAFAAPFIWEHPDLSPGRSLSAARDLGVASIYVEGRGGGQVRQTDLDCYVDGVLRVLEHLGMIAAAPTPRHQPRRVRGNGDTDGGISAETAGFFVTAAGVGDVVAAGDVLGRVLDEDGATCAIVRAPLAGVVMLLRRLSPIDSGDTLAIVAELAEGAADD